MKRLLLLLLLFAGCAPGQIVRTGYLVTVTQNHRTELQKLETSAKADSFILIRTGIPLKTDSLMDTMEYFFEFRNGIFSVYAEKKGIYKRRENGKERWRMFDEKLIRR